MKCNAVESVHKELSQEWPYQHGNFGVNVSLNPLVNPRDVIIYHETELKHII
jgi:hypothetical protein